MTTHRPIAVSPNDPVFNVEDSDPGATPASDFYRFVNGGWIDNNPVPLEYGAWGAIQEIHQQNEEKLGELLETAAKDSGALQGTPEHWVGAYYRSGLDAALIEELGITPIQPLLDRIDGIKTVDDIAPLVAELHRIGIGALFDVGVMPDFEDTSINLLYFGQSGLGLPDRDYYFRDDDTSRELLSDYQSHVATLFRLLGSDDPDAAAATVLEIETAIASESYTNVQLRDVELVTNKRSTDALAKAMPTFGLAAYLHGLGAATVETTSIDNEGFYPMIDAMLTSTPLASWRTYFTWHVIRATASSLPSAFDEASFAFYGTKLGGQKQQKARWKRVLAAATGDIGQLVGQVYVRDNFPPEAKADVEHLVDRLFVAMREALNEATWMGDATRAEALAKLDGFGYKIGYPDEWRDYSGLELSDSKWLENRLAASRFEFDRRARTIGDPVDPEEWSMPPHMVNAYYSPLRNEIVFPAGILQAPFFSSEADAAVNYGGIGGVIGHEITHGFDDQGSRFDAEGTVRDWWAEDDRVEFDRRAQVMIDQFNGYEIEEGLYVNGELTLGENIADLGGLKIAFRALEAELDGTSGDVAGLSPQQRFFMSWATVWRRNYTDEYVRTQVRSDPHAPSDLRCTVPMSNLESFAEAFGIPEEAAAMRPLAERVDIW
jgi:putative endopeptidase